MKKLTICVLLLTLFSFAFPSCQKPEKEEILEQENNRAIVGAWQAVSLATRYWNEAGQELQSDPPYLYGTGSLVLTFKDDGTYFLRERSTTYPWRLQYQIRGNKLIREGKETEFHINGNTLTLIDTGEQTQNGQRYRWQSTMIMNRI